MGVGDGIVPHRALIIVEASKDGLFKGQMLTLGRQIGNARRQHLHLMLGEGVTVRLSSYFFDLQQRLLYRYEELVKL